MWGIRFWYKQCTAHRFSTGTDISKNLLFVVHTVDLLLWAKVVLVLWIFHIYWCLRCVLKNKIAGYNPRTNVRRCKGLVLFFIKKHFVTQNQKKTRPNIKNLNIIKRSWCSNFPDFSSPNQCTNFHCKLTSTMPYYPILNSYLLMINSQQYDNISTIS